MGQGVSNCLHSPSGLDLPLSLAVLINTTSSAGVGDATAADVAVERGDQVIGGGLDRLATRSRLQGIPVLAQTTSHNLVGPQQCGGNDSVGVLAEALARLAWVHEKLGADEVANSIVQLSLA